MRILYISGREFGLVGTPGTYLVAEGYAEVADFKMIAKPIFEQNDNIAHKQRGNFPVIEIDFNQADSVEKLIEEVSNFDPDCVCFGGVRFGRDRTAVSLAKEVKKRFSQLNLFLEIKSHLINPEILKDDQKYELESNTQLWTGIIALNRAMAETWFGELQTPLLEHKIIIDYDGFTSKVFPENSVKCNKFIFCGTVDKSRKFDEFIQLVQLLPPDLKEKITIDVFGRGPDLSKHKALVEQLGMDCILHFKRPIPQSELLQRYGDYDSGIAWVPPDRKFNCAASLKLVEYCAAGLVPIVTSTAGHRLSVEDGGFNVGYFDADSHSFEKVIRMAVTKGMEARLLQENIKNAAPFDYSSVVKNDILPFYRDNIKHPLALSETTAPIINENNGVVINNLTIEVKFASGTNNVGPDFNSFTHKVADRWIPRAKKYWSSKMYPRIRKLARRTTISKNMHALRDRLRKFFEAVNMPESKQKKLEELTDMLSHKEKKISFLEIELRKFVNNEIDNIIETEFTKKVAKFEFLRRKNVSNEREV